MFNDLPPGVSEYDLPGNRPEDEEVEVTMVLSRGDINDLKEYNSIQMQLPVDVRHKLWATISNIVEWL